MTDAKRPLTEAGRSITRWAEVGDGSITRLVVECERQAVAAYMPDYLAAVEALELIVISDEMGGAGIRGYIEKGRAALARLRDEVPA